MKLLICTPMWGLQKLFRDLLINRLNIYLLPSLSWQLVKRGLFFKAYMILCFLVQNQLIES